MNRYRLWQYLLIVFVLVAGAFYTLPNLYGESPAIQISALRGAPPPDNALTARVEQALADAKITPVGLVLDKTLRIKLPDTEVQVHAKEVAQKALGENYLVALNLLPNTPGWLEALGAKPMALGLDLRGGVRFLLEVDMSAAVQKIAERSLNETQRVLRAERIRITSARQEDAARPATGGDTNTATELQFPTLRIELREAQDLAAASKALTGALSGLRIEPVDERTLRLVFPLTEQNRIRTDAVRQNLSALNNRINELGVAEPVIQQQGTDRIVVELPGIQDTAKAKDIIGRTATLEVRMADQHADRIAAAKAGLIPPGYELLTMSAARGRGDQPVLVRKQVELTGDNIVKAEPAFDHNQQAIIAMGLDATGGTIFRQLTREHIGEQMAIVLVEKNHAEVITAPRINSELGGQFQIEGGGMTVEEANDIALLVRAGTLAAPMTIVEERTVGPTLGRENIQQGFYSTLYGFIAIALFMCVYYRVFGVLSACALGANLLLLLAALSILGVTLTLPGIAAVALTLGMAIDANVLINERIREEVRAGLPPQASIQAGYRHAWSTIIDSNITTLIAGAALLLFGSGSIRGFAWVHCIGILTSMFSAVFISRGLVNATHGYRRTLRRLAV